jgi:hypothetical protein
MCIGREQTSAAEGTEGELIVSVTTGEADTRQEQKKARNENDILIRDNGNLMLRGTPYLCILMTMCLFHSTVQQRTQAIAVKNQH